MKLLEARDLVKVYHGKNVVKNVTLEVSSSEVTGLLGPNGAGKTTTFYMMVGLVRPDSGKVIFDGIDITDIPMYLRARLGITYLPQEPSVFRKLTVAENIMAILETIKISSAARKERLRNLLTELNISHLANEKVYNLSGGERRRVEITRSLVISPKFMLLDEPFAGIDPLAVIDIQGIILNLKKKGIGILVSDHNVRETLKVCDRAYIMHRGEILEEGTPDTIAQSDVARKIYLGEEFKLGV